MAAPHLLVVDDTPEIALIVRRLGKHAGQEVTACADVPAAWEYLQRTQYSVPRPGKRNRPGTG
jgi:CheY-like chemotaxis protein